MEAQLIMLVASVGIVGVFVLAGVVWILCQMSSDCEEWGERYNRRRDQ